jgi:hypothetical protein
MMHRLVSPFILRQHAAGHVDLGGADLADVVCDHETLWSEGFKTP